MRLGGFVEMVHVLCPKPPKVPGVLNLCLRPAPWHSERHCNAALGAEKGFGGGRQPPGGLRHIDYALQPFAEIALRLPVARVRSCGHFSPIQKRVTETHFRVTANAHNGRNYICTRHNYQRAQLYLYTKNIPLI